MFTVCPSTSCFNRSKSSPVRSLAGVFGVCGVPGLGFANVAGFIGAMKPLVENTLCNGGRGVEASISISVVFILSDAFVSSFTQ